MYKKILVPLDGSPHAESVLPQVEDLAKRFNAKVSIIRAVYVNPLTTFDVSEAQVRVVGEAQSYVEDVEKRLREKGLDVSEAVVWYDEPVQAILEHANWSGADLIVMASHGRGGLRGLLHRSVAAQVAKASKVPVLIDSGVPERDKRKVKVSGGQLPAYNRS